MLCPLAALLDFYLYMASSCVSSSDMPPITSTANESKLMPYFNRLKTVWIKYKMYIMALLFLFALKKYETQYVGISKRYVEFCSSIRNDYHSTKENIIKIETQSNHRCIKHMVLHSIMYNKHQIKRHATVFGY